MFSLLRHQKPVVGHVLAHSVNLTFRPKSGLKNKYRARDGFSLQNEIRLQLWRSGGWRNIQSLPCFSFSCTVRWASRSSGIRKKFL